MNCAPTTTNKPSQAKLTEKRCEAITYGYVVSVDVIGSFLVINRLQFKSGMVIRQDVRETILWSVTRQVGKCAGLVPSNMFQFFEFLTKSIAEKIKREHFYNRNFVEQASPEIGICGHHPVVVGEIVDSDGSTGLDD